MQAIWNNRIIAESDETVVVDGTHYFPFESVNHEALEKSSTVAYAKNKGEARYYSLVVDDQVLPDAAFCYARPRQGVEFLRARIAFGRGVKVVDSNRPAVQFVPDPAAAGTQPYA